jgi:6-phosphofructokinase
VLAREREGKEFGVIVLAEGLAQYMPARYLEGVKFDDHGNISLSQTNLARNMTKLVEAEYEHRTGKRRRVTGVQLGYEARCALPHAFDVILGSQLGVGAYRALVENQSDGVLVSCSGQLNLSYVPFEDLVDPETLVTVVRFIQRGSDFQRLARFLENYSHE